MALKNKMDEKTGKFLCGGSTEQRRKTGKGCGTEVTVGRLIHGVLYCTKCAETLKGLRDEKGMLKY